MSTLHSNSDFHFPLPSLLSNRVQKLVLFKFPYVVSVPKFSGRFLLFFFLIMNFLQKMGQKVKRHF